MQKRYHPIPTRELRQFVTIVRRLRRDCPWDREQTHQSIRESLIEEAYEVVETIDENNLNELKRELGDLLLHVVMHATIAEEAVEFTLRDVIREISEKLIRRHPHIFGKVKVKDAHEVKHNWEKLKLTEGRTSILEGVPRGMPALHHALRIQERAARVGFDWKRREDVWNKVLEEVHELKTALRRRSLARREEEFGDYMFALVNYARFIGVNPESALRSTTRKFTQRFQHIERELKSRGRDVHTSTLEEMDTLWNEAKSREPARGARRPGKI